MKKYKTTWYNYKGQKRETERDTMCTVYGYIKWEDFVSTFNKQQKIKEFNEMFEFTCAPNWTFLRKEVFVAGILASVWNFITNQPNTTYEKIKYVGVKELQPLTQDQIDFASSKGITILGDSNAFKIWFEEFIPIWKGTPDEIQ